MLELLAIACIGTALLVRYVPWIKKLNDKYK